MKKIMNKPTEVVGDALMGLQMAYPDALSYIPKLEVICRKEKKIDKVALISGGGAGHEPLHAGYVGKGMLDAAVHLFAEREMYFPPRARIGSALP